MKYNNRELSWLAFNERVLQEAQDKSVHLLQRLRFLGIYSNNLDEFIKVRVANLLRKVGKEEENVEKTPTSELLNKINTRINTSRDIFDTTYRKLLSEMEDNNIFILREDELNSEQISFCRSYFSENINQWVVPIILRKKVKLPLLSDKHNYIGIKMIFNDAAKTRYAIIQIPLYTVCSRFIQIPSDDGRVCIIFIDDIIRLCLDEIFFMFKYDTLSAYTFKFIRDGYLNLDDDASQNIAKKIEIGLKERLKAIPVSLVYDKAMPLDLLNVISERLKLGEESLIKGDRYRMMKDLMKFPIIQSELEDTAIEPLQHFDVKKMASVIHAVRSKDILLHYPYHSFDHLLDFLHEATIDPKVKKIHITLYRTAEQSKVVNILINGARNGKEVFVVNELKARFDEELNLRNTKLMRKAGVHVTHGFGDFKVHCKLVLIERKEKEKTSFYSYIGTGNFNENTASVYSDFGLLTANPKITTDIKTVFNLLENKLKEVPPQFNNLLVSPYFMRKTFKKLIEGEITNHQSGKKAYIYAKFNSLTDTKMINLLYKASQAGVEVRLIVRGACCLRPEEDNLSENIKAISIVDKYLEHARIVFFCNDGDEQVFISSADWMTRNLDRRIEIAVPIEDTRIKNTLKDVFNIQWADNVKARNLKDIDKNSYINNQKNPIRSQIALYDYYKNK